MPAKPVIAALDARLSSKGMQVPVLYRLSMECLAKLQLLQVSVCMYVCVYMHVWLCASLHLCTWLSECEEEHECNDGDQD